LNVPWGGDEELKEGSDYELLNLDAELRKKNAQYIEFATQLCISRIRFGLLGRLPEGWSDQAADRLFAETFESSPSISEIVSNHLSNKRIQVTPWIDDVRSSLNAHIGKIGNLGVHGIDDINYIISTLQFPKDPLTEKTSTFLFYSAWQSQKDLVTSAKSIGISADAYFNHNDVTSIHAKKLGHFRDDMRDQMLADLKLDKNVGANGLMSRYLGFETWVRMSDGIIRNLITTLKHVYDWSLFRVEDIYASGGISLKSQYQGIQDASRWFVSDANVLEVDRGMVETGIKRISTLLRKIRFSAKPSECSLCRFSVNLNAIDSRARLIIEAAEMWSLLIRDSDRKQRNPGEHLTLLRINPLVAPDYYLPISARGNIDLNPTECLAIFGTQDEAAFKSVERERTNRCTPPFAKRPVSDIAPEDELNLF
jgi:hypothetical protein